MMRKSVLFFVGLLVLCLFAGGVSAYSGSGTASDPFILTSANDLQSLSGTGIGVAPFSTSAYYELGADIDLEGAVFTPIGTSSYYFTGNFDGKGHRISNVTIQCSSKYANSNAVFWGLNGGTVKDIVFDGFLFIGVNGCNRNAVCCGDAKNNAVISGITVLNSYMNFKDITTAYTSGFIIGDSLGSSISNCNIDNCIIDCSGYWGYTKGGVLGYCNGVISISNCTVTNCYCRDDGASSRESDVGGIVGKISASSTITISDCSITRCTLRGDTYIGGVYGNSMSCPNVTVTDCTVSDCSIIGTSNVAGVGN